jgi:hypothetical protein
MRQLLRLVHSDVLYRRNITWNTLGLSGNYSPEAPLDRRKQAAYSEPPLR